MKDLIRRSNIHLICIPEENLERLGNDLFLRCDWDFFRWKTQNHRYNLYKVDM